MTSFIVGVVGAVFAFVIILLLTIGVITLCEAKPDE
jgi:hypothetical protein